LPSTARHATPTGSIPPHLLRAYRDTIYVAGGIAIRIGHRTPDALFAHLNARGATLLTAWNPLSRRMPAGWNRRMQRRLRERLRRTPALPAEGALRRWHEAHLLAAGDPRPLVRLARIFRQRGVVVLRRRQCARLVLLPGVTDAGAPS
jgi:uncharacterized protein DUF3293